MQRLLFSLLLVINFSLSLFASSATTQEHLVSLLPVEGADDVRTKSLVKVAFDREIIAPSVKKHTIELKPINPEGKKVSAKITIDEKSTLVFTPDELLKEGKYRVKINPVKLKADKDDYQLSSFMKKLLYWLCSWFYDDISECPLCKRFYKAPSFIKTKTIKYNFSVVDRPEILSIKLNATSLELNEGDKLQLNAVASYDDNSAKDVSKEVTWNIDNPQEALWIINNPQIASIDSNATLNAIQEGTVQITATLENITSQTLLLSVRKVINGHVLPPEPDKTLNGSTLLGVDSNNNGVRDDVERKIYFQYKRPIEQAYMMQQATWYPQILEDPVAAATSKKLQKEMWNRSSCKGYLRLQGIKMQKKSANFMEEAYFNTRERMRAYIEFNEAMSGGVYSIPLLRDANKENCDFNITKMLEMEK